MRIISGKSRGSKLFSPEGDDTRPTLDRVREAIFSMIQCYIPEARVLDLFAGSGAMGLEALSRGAEYADFVDVSSSACGVVKKNIEKTCLENCKVHNMDFKRFLEGCDAPYDVIFIDPPYRAGYYKEALDAILDRSLLSDEGIIVAESSEDDLDTGDFEVYRKRTYGKVSVYVLCHKERE